MADQLEAWRLIQRSDVQVSITNLGAILFARNFKEFDAVGREAPRVLIYDGKGKFATTRRDQTFSKGYGFEELIGFINGQLPANEVIGRALRRDMRMFPELAIRELVANALVHQDFGKAGTGVVVGIYSDRMEISSPGRPFIAPERFIDSYQSRNENLAEIM